MTQYMLSVHSETGEPREPMTDEEMRLGFEQVATLEREMRSVGALLYSGRLLEPDQARVVRPTKGRVRMTDGPFAETKEQLGGFYIIEADDMDSALRWAEKVTLAIDSPIEVRPFMDDPR